MDGIVKWGLIGIGGYLLAQKLGLVQGDLLGQVLGGATATTTTTTASEPTPTQIVQATSLGTTANLLEQARIDAGEPALLSVDQWNYYYQKVRGGNGIDWAQLATPAKPRDYLMSISEFMAYYGGGLAGLGMLGGFDWDAHMRSGGAKYYEQMTWREM